MTTSFRLKFGRSPGSTAESILTTPVTLFVGPNNSGKSRALYEIEQRCRTGTELAANVILDEIVFEETDESLAIAAIERLRRDPGANDRVPHDHIVVASQGRRLIVAHKHLIDCVRCPSSDIYTFCSCFLNHLTPMLDGRSRIDLVAEQAAGDLLERGTSSLQVLFQDDTKRQEVRRIIQEAFGVYFVIDANKLGQLRIRLSTNAPKDDIEERGIHAASAAFHSKAQDIQTASDGVKAFTGIITQLIAGDPRIVLIDEPEAFLHPSLAYKLGYEASRAVSSSEQRLFISTHSPTFLMGCVQSGAPTNIVRLTYRNGTATARVLPNADVVQFMKNPLLRSAGVLSALFYECVVVTEADTDRAFYQEINERLLRWMPDFGIKNCLFINAQNKQTIPTILGPLRKLGIPTVGIFDIDVVKEGGAVWIKLLDNATVPSLLTSSLGTLRSEVKRAFDASGRDMKRDGGIDVLRDSEREATRSLFDQLADYGILVVPGGEVESWLKHLGVTGHGPNWLVEMFTKMGADPDSNDYVRPTQSDVWNFMGKINQWFVDPDKKGIPA